MGLDPYSFPILAQNLYDSLSPVNENMKILEPWWRHLPASKHIWNGFVVNFDMRFFWEETYFRKRIDYQEIQRRQKNIQQSQSSFLSIMSPVLLCIF